MDSYSVIQLGFFLPGRLLISGITLVGGYVRNSSRKSENPQDSSRLTRSSRLSKGKRLSFV